MPSSREVSAYLRIASLSIALYEVLATLRGEFHLYRKQWLNRRISIACICFFLIRYLSITTLVTSTIGFFGTNFSPAQCSIYFRVAPAFKLLSLVVSQFIVAVRTYAICRKARGIFWFLLILFIVALIPEVLGSVLFRLPVQNSTGNCTAGNPADDKISWAFYAAAMVYDGAASVLASYYLYNMSPGVTFMNDFTRIMFEDGLLYFFSLTAVNALNVVLFNLNDPATQPSGANLATAVTLIMSQRLILDLQGHGEDSRMTGLSVSDGLPSGFGGRRPGRTAHHTKGMVPATDFLGVATAPADVELGTVRVQVDVEVQQEAGQDAKSTAGGGSASVVSTDDEGKYGWGKGEYR